jgi:hypothetical protein
MTNAHQVNEELGSAKEEIQSYLKIHMEILPLLLELWYMTGGFAREFVWEEAECRG